MPILAFSIAFVLLASCVLGWYCRPDDARRLLVPVGNFLFGVSAVLFTSHFMREDVAVGMRAFLMCAAGIMTIVLLDFVRVIFFDRGGERGPFVVERYLWSVVAALSVVIAPVLMG